MTAYLYITLSLLLYPIIGYLFVGRTKKSPRLQIIIVCILSVMSIATILGLFTHTITISQNLNWLLVTNIYLAFSLLLWLGYYSGKKAVRIVSKLVMFLFFGLGYLAATIGFFFIAILSYELDTDQRIWLTDNLIYKEKALGSGPDPSYRLREVEVYKTVSWFPLIATRIKTKTYDEWCLMLKSHLDVSYSKEKQALYLSSEFKGNKKSYWADTIQLAERP